MSGSTSTPTIASPPYGFGTIGRVVVVVVGGTVVVVVGCRVVGGAVDVVVVVVAAPPPQAPKTRAKEITRVGPRRRIRSILPDLPT
jgi:hypothetical protein